MQFEIKRGTQKGVSGVEMRLAKADMMLTDGPTHCTRAHLMMS